MGFSWAFAIRFREGIGQFLRYGMDFVENLESHRASTGTVGFFASPIYRKKLREKETEWKELNDEIAVNLKRLMVRDEKGIEWSKTHYAGGYTSYFSLPALQKWVPPIQKLEEWLEPHIEEFRKEPWRRFCAGFFFV